MRFAIIQTGGKQYKVQEGSLLKVEKLEAQTGQTITFDKVLLIFEEGTGLTLGKPYIANMNVYGEVVEQAKGPKIIIFKYKPKKRERKKTGHRQSYTSVKITSIGEQKKEKSKVESKEKPKAIKKSTTKTKTRS